MSKVLKFQPKKIKGQGKSKATPANGRILDEGTLGKMKYRVFKRGVIHIFNNAETLLFKKSCDVFEKEVEDMDLNKLKDGDEIKMEGSGDNDTLIFTCKNNNIEITLEKPEYSMLTKLKKVLSGGRRK